MPLAWVWLMTLKYNESALVPVVGFVDERCRYRIAPPSNCDFAEDAPPLPLSKNVLLRTTLYFVPLVATLPMSN